MASHQEVPLIVAWGGGPHERDLVVSKTPGEPTRGGWEAWPDPVPEWALLLLWPRSFPWGATSTRFAETLRARGGAVYPLTTVLNRAGIRVGRGWVGLAKALLPGWGDLEDPEEAARAMGDMVATLLAGMDPDRESAPDSVAPGESARSTAPTVRIALAELPASPGIYFLRDGGGALLYVGKALSLRDRVPQHFRDGGTEEDKRRRLAATREVHWEETGTELEALLREHRCILALDPRINTQVEVQSRPRGSWRVAEALIVLPSARRGYREVCLVAGNGRFHWERVPGKMRIPRTLAARVRAFLSGEVPGWAPGEPGTTLEVREQASLVEITLSWLTRHGDRVNRIDLRGERAGRSLWNRVRRLLAEDPRGGRVLIP